MGSKLLRPANGFLDPEELNLLLKRPAFRSEALKLLRPNRPSA